MSAEAAVPPNGGFTLDELKRARDVIVRNSQELLCFKMGHRLDVHFNGPAGTGEPLFAVCKRCTREWDLDAVPAGKSYIMP